MSETPETQSESRVGLVVARVGEKIHETWDKSHLFLGGLALSATIGFGVGATAGPLVISSESTAGPNKIEVTPTLDYQITLDFGPGDEAITPSDNVFGARIVIKGLKDNPKGDDISVLSSSFKAYANVLSDLEKIQNDATNAVIDTAKVTGGVSALFLGVFYSAGFLALGEERRKYLADKFKDNSRIIVAAGLTAVLSTSGLISYNLVTQDGSIKKDPQFAGTSLEDWEIKSSIFRSTFSQILGYFNQNEDYASELRKNLHDTSLASPILKADDESFTVVIAGNIKCNSVAPPIIEEVIKESGSSFLLLPGDLTFSGTSIENSCVSNIAFHSGKAEEITSGANHGSEETLKTAQSEGMTVLRRKIIDVGGYRWLGDASPRRSVFGNGTEQIRDETETEMGYDLANIACSAKKPLFALIVNEPHAAEATAENGCATLVVAAAERSTLIEKTNIDGSKTWYFLAGNLSGAVQGGLSLGEFQDIGEITVMEFDKGTMHLEAKQTISLHPSKRVEIPAPTYYGLDFPIVIPG